MQSDDINNKRKISTSVEIVDVPPPTDNETSFKADDASAGATKLSKEELQLLFQGRNLAFLSTLSKDGSPHVTPVWAEMVEEDLILINTLEASAKNKHITNDNREPYRLWIKTIHSIWRQ